MANKHLTIDAKTWETDGASVVGKRVNVYKSFLGAKNKTVSELATARELNVDTGSAGDVITQTVGVTGPLVDTNGMLNIFVDDSETTEVFLSPVAQVDAVTKVPVNDFGKLGIQRYVVA